MALVFMGCKNENTTGDERVDEHTNTTQNEPEAENMESTDSQVLTTRIESKSGSNVSGTVTFTEENGEVMLKAELSGLTEGTHAMHLHENADCSAEDASSAGGHWNPTFEDHGEWGDEDGYHKGDIGNFDANAEGNATVEFSTDEWCIGCDDEKKNIIGKAVIIHDGVDDYTSQPSGDAGTRIGCAVIKT